MWFEDACQCSDQNSNLSNKFDITLMRDLNEEYSLDDCRQCPNFDISFFVCPKETYYAVLQEVDMTSVSFIFFIQKKCNSFKIKEEVWRVMSIIH